MGKIKERKRQLSLSPFFPPCLRVWLFLLSPLASSSQPLRWHCASKLVLSPLSLLCVPTPITFFQWPIPLHRGGPPVGATFTAWLVQSEIPVGTQGLFQPLTPSKLSQTFRFPLSQGEPLYSSSSVFQSGRQSPDPRDMR